MYAGRFKVPLPQSWGRGFGVHISGKDARIEIGRKLVTRENVSIRAQNGKLSIGHNCFINANTNITCIESVTIGDRCQFGPNVVIVDHDHDYKGISSEPLISGPVVIGENVWIGANSVILRGANIGDGAVIAAGSIIKGEVPSGHIAYQQRETVIKPFSRQS